MSKDNDLRNALTPGTEFEGYRIERMLGAGGFGITYLATEVLLDRQVAIKEFLPTSMVTRDPDGLSILPLGATHEEDFAWGMDRFRTEAQTLVAFRHPNIVGVHRYFETNNTGYLVMEFVAGETLRARLLPDRTLSEEELIALVDPLLDGLQAVHDRDFLHRDIKPANIFIREDGSPVLIDFGAARQALGRHSKSLTAIVSEGYAPYEQYDSAGDQGPWTDIYAVGGVLYRCVTGIRPPDAPSRVTALVRGEDDPMTPAARAAREGYSPEFLDAIDQAIAIRENDRPQSVQALRALIQPAAHVPTLQEVSRSADRTLLAGGDVPVDTEVPSDDDRVRSGPAPSAIPAPAATPPRRSLLRRRHVAAPVAAVMLGAAAVGAWGLGGDSLSPACQTAFDSARRYIAAKDPKQARTAIGAAQSDCPSNTVSTLMGQVTTLESNLKQAAEKRAEEARRQREAERKRLADLAERKRKAEAAERRRKQQEAERKRKADEAERKRREAEAERKRLAEEAERKRREAEARRLAEEKKRQEAEKKKALAATCSGLQTAARRQSETDRVGQLGELHRRAQSVGCPAEIRREIGYHLKVKQAQEAFNAGRLPSSISLLTQAIQVRPEARLYYWRGVSSRRLGRLPSAYRDFGKAIALNPREAKYYGARIAVTIALYRLALRQGRRGHAQRMKAAAIGDLRVLVRLRPDNRRARALLRALTRPPRIRRHTPRPRRNQRPPHRTRHY